MARLGIDVAAIDVRRFLADGRTDKGIAIVVERLRKGMASPEMRAIAADLLAPPKRGRGAPKKAEPTDWHEVGMRFDSLEQDGLTYEAACRELAGEMGQSERSIQRAVAYYRDMVEGSRQ